MIWEEIQGLFFGAGPGTAWEFWQGASTHAHTHTLSCTATLDPCSVSSTLLFDELQLSSVIKTNPTLHLELNTFLLKIFKASRHHDTICKYVFCTSAANLPRLAQIKLFSSTDKYVKILL